MPQGRAFFTGDQAKPDDAKGGGGAAAAAPTASSSGAAAAGVATSRGSTSDRPASSASAGVVRPGAARSASSAKSTGAAGSGRRGFDEGEETVLGEIEGGGVGDAGLAEGKGKTGASLLKSKSGGSSRKKGGLGDKDDEDGEAISRPRPTASKASSSMGAGDGPIDYTYDSDSSDEEMEGRASGPTWSSLAPSELPFPSLRPYGGHQHILYNCQREETAAAMSAPAGSSSAAAVPDAVTSVSEEKKNDGGGTTTDAEVGAVAPVFLNLQTASAEDRAIESNTFTLFKLPTRLPRIAPTCKMKSDPDASGIEPMEVESSEAAAGGGLGSQHQPNRYPGAPMSAGNRFDDTLRSAPSGRYGKIRIRKSGKAVLVVGEGTPEEVTLNLNQGIPCSMLQQAVNIDPLEASFVTMGEVHHSVVATPNILETLLI